MFGSAAQAMITVVDRSGRKSTVARDWAGFGLAWAPSGTEIWFTATRPAPGEFAPSLHAVSLSGVERPVYRAPDWLVLHDISEDGRVLLSRNTIQYQPDLQATRGHQRARPDVAAGLCGQGNLTRRQNAGLRG